MNARALGFQSAMIKSAALYAGTLPDWEKRKLVAKALVGGAALGAAGTAAIVALMNRRRDQRLAPRTAKT